MTGEATNEYCRLKFFTTLAIDLHATLREDQWNCQTTNGTLASQTEYKRLAEEGFPCQLSQVWQAMGTNQGDHPISGELFQLDLAA
jgi:hypothetical protein